MALLVFVAAAITIGIVLPWPEVDTIRAAVAEGGGWAAASFVAAYAVASLTPVPKSAVSIAAGLAWGLPLGFALVYAGALLGAFLAFGVSRLLGRSLVERLTGARVSRVDDLLRDRGVPAVVGARLVPVVPFTVLNYTAGLTSVRLRDYAVGSSIGMIPGTVAYVAVGAYGVGLDWPFFVAMGALGALTIGGAAYAVRTRSKVHGRAAAAVGARAPRAAPSVDAAGSGAEA